MTAVSRGGPVPTRWIVRLLGARMTAQGVAVAARPAPLVALAGAAADAAHAASMLLSVRYLPRYRRPALASAAMAAGFAAALSATARPREQG